MRYKNRCRFWGEKKA